jgi:hypothetical protein
MHSDRASATQSHALRDLSEQELTKRGIHILDALICGNSVHDDQIDQWIAWKFERAALFGAEHELNEDLVLKNVWADEKRGDRYVESLKNSCSRGEIEGVSWISGIELSGKEKTPRLILGLSSGEKGMLKVEVGSEGMERLYQQLEEIQGKLDGLQPQ